MPDTNTYSVSTYIFFPVWQSRFILIWLRLLEKMLMQLWVWLRPYYTVKHVNILETDKS
jgi:hypothetical protein